MQTIFRNARGHFLLMPGAVIFFTLLIALSFVPPAEAMEIVVNVVVNQVPRGEFFVQYTGDQDILVRPQDMQAMGFRVPVGKAVSISGDTYLSLRSIRGLSFVFHEQTVSLEIDSPPELLAKQALDFASPQRLPVFQPRETSAFLNYRVDYLGSDIAGTRSFRIENELGIRKNDILFLTNTTYADTTTEKKFVRLFTSAIHDRRTHLDRVVVGDFFASSGALGSTLNLGGLSYSKAYSINPYLVRNPTIDYKGVVALPSEVEVYLNGVRIRTEKIQPGEFALTSITATGGAGTVEVLIRDPFGREQWLRHPFYFTDLLLKEGFHDYSYNIGLVREDYGVKSSNYGDFAFSAFHRYGLTSALTLGFRGEGSGGQYSLGPEASYLLGTAGTVTMSLAASLDKYGKEGAAGWLNYGYRGRRLSGQLYCKSYTEHYSTVEDSSTPMDKTRSEIGAGIGYSARTLGSITFDLAATGKHVGQDRQTQTISYSRSLTGTSALFATVRRIREARTGYEAFVGLTFYPGKESSIAANYRRDRDTNTETLHYQKNQPPGEGLGYRLAVERTGSQNTSYAVMPSVQYNGPYGIYRGEYFGRNSRLIQSSSYNLSASGAAVYAGNTFGVTRPVEDSFALVKVGDIEDVRVYRNNQAVGRTNAEGKMFIPDLGSYYNSQVSISGVDVPIDHYMPEVRKYVSPSLRSGAVIDFAVRKIRAISGKLRVQLHGIVKPIEFQEVIVIIDGKEYATSTGRDGEFYLENVQPGRHRAVFMVNDHRYVYDMEIPASDKMIVDLGGILL